MEPTPTPDPLPERVRASAAGVAERARLVRIDPAALDRLGDELDPTPPVPYPEERWSGSPEERAMAVLAWNAVNFGSGWFPHVHKLPGHSGARTMGARWQSWCRTHGVPDAGWLSTVGVEQVAEVFGQPLGGEVRGLLGAFVTAWHELGDHLLGRHDGSAVDLVASAGGSGAALAEELAGLPSWHDRHTHDGRDVPLYKRAQIAVSNLSAAFADPSHGSPPERDLGAFRDLDRLTAFADNLVPHVLKMRGVLRVDADLDARIEREELLVSGEPGEVELRAVAVHAVELLVARLHDAGHTTATAASVDHRLWQVGQDPEIKSRPRHRCRCTFY